MSFPAKATKAQVRAALDEAVEIGDEAIERGQAVVGAYTDGTVAGLVVAIERLERWLDESGELGYPDISEAA